MNPNQILIDSGRKFVVAVCGGGQQVLGELTRHGGMSHTMLGGFVPYSPQSFYEFVGGVPDKIVSSRAARMAAMAAYQKARSYAPSWDDKVFGLASTGAVVKVGGEREGRQHRVFIGMQEDKQTLVGNITLKSGRTRNEEERVVSDCIIQMLKWGCHRMASVFHPALEGPLTVDDNFFLEYGVPEHHDYAVVCGLMTRSHPDHKVKAIFSSSLNPMHDGHLNIIRTASKILGTRVDIELCVKNPDKGTYPLDYITIHDRRTQTKQRIHDQGVSEQAGEFIVANRPFYFDKAEIYPGATFVVGVDTYDRILDERYYPQRGVDIMLGLSKMTRNGNRFLVFPRKGYRPSIPVRNRVTETLQFAAEEITDIVTPFDGYEISDISSTSIRKGAANVHVIP